MQLHLHISEGAKLCLEIRPQCFDLAVESRREIRTQRIDLTNELLLDIATEHTHAFVADRAAEVVEVHL